MSSDTFLNLVGCSIFGALGVTCLVCAIAFSASHQLLFTAMCFLMFYVLYTDNQYNTESVQHYFRKMLRLKDYGKGNVDNGYCTGAIRA